MDERDIVVSIETNIETLRAMLSATDTALRVWPGGDASEQERLIQMKTQLYACLMSALFDNDLI
ncbi:MAG: hypothetical protein CL959_01820 [Euryarchaeota archaeon]|nr:hypothetical protein [Euryarchaeota archaeon]|tara:strand:+ start:1077 stop:1268 length:192 start_codon:yes stop_codon:yes gene_type:complete